MRTLLSILLVVGILAASAAIAVALHTDAVAGARDADQAIARQGAEALQKTLQPTAFRLRGVAGLFEASDEVSMSEFRTFTRPLLDEQRALLGVAWMPQITERRRGAYELLHRQITEGPLQARRRAPRRAAHFPVTYLETDSFARVLGFDGGSDPARRVAMSRAILGASTQATSPITLAGTGKPGIILYQPVFLGETEPRTSAERERNVHGIVAGSYGVDALLAALRRSVPAGVELQVRQDGTQIGGPRHMAGGESSGLAVAGRWWSVRATSNRSPSPLLPGAALLAGAALALLLVLMLRQAYTRERYALTMVDDRMRERDAAQRELEGARATAQALAAEQGALRRVATRIAAEDPLDSICETIRNELVRLLGARDSAVVRTGDGHSPSEPAWLGRKTAGSVVRCEIRVGDATRGTIAVLDPRADEHVMERLGDFADLASVAVANAEARQELAVRASTDGLTGLLNRRTFDERLEGEVRRAVRHGRPLALAIVDIDHFKRVNDRHGHLAGDAVLADVAAFLQTVARRGDAVARIGGEEFAWIMPETDIPEGFDVAERVRAAVAAADYDATTDLTISIGIAALGDAVTGDALYRHADTALFHAKRSGRNRTVRHDPTQQLSATAGGA